jgi:hypothetical protein
MHNRDRGMTLLIGLAAVVLATCARAALAQSAIAPPKAPGNQPQVPVLALVADPAVKDGKVAAIQGTVDGKGLRFAVGGLSILQPVVVMLLSRDIGDDLTVSLFKGEWQTARRTGSTKGSGITQFEFRTEGALNILLRGPAKPTPFALVVWAGNELHPPMKDVVVTYDEFKKRQRGR